MHIILSFTFIYFILLFAYYFLINYNLDYDNLFIIILNFIFLIILPIYYIYFQDNLYSIFIAFFLVLSSFFFNLKIKEIYRCNKLFPLFYFIITCYILEKILLVFIYSP